jgi:hypothetical protein
MSAVTGTTQFVGQNVIAFKFALNQMVLIDAIDTKGRVIEMNVDTGGRNYLVAYFNDDKDRRREWLAEVELSAC